MRDVLQIHLEADAIDHGEVRLTSLEGHETLSQLFDFQIELATTREEGLATDDLVGAPASLVFARAGEVTRRLHGLVAEISELFGGGPGAQVRRYRLRLAPRAYRLSLNQALEIFMDRSVPDIARAVLEARGFRPDEDFELRLTGSYPAREFVVQYRESDLDFLGRLTEHLGITYFFEHDGAVDRLILSDHNAAFGPVAGGAHLELRGRDDERGVFELTARTRTLPAQYVLRDYNYRTPGIDLTVTEPVVAGGAGDVLEYGAHFKTKAEGAALARIRAEELRATHKVFEGRSVEERLAAGSAFTLEGFPGGDLELLVTAVRHSARQAGHFAAGDGPPRYENALTAIDARTRYRPPRRTPRPRVEGLLTGVIDAAQKGPYAELDGEGRYRVKFLYDTADTGGGQASRLVRMAQPHAGGGYGMHFPLRPGVEVLLQCVNGDPDRPIISGTVANPGTPGPVTSGNAARNIIRTGGGNEINIDDTDGQKRIKLTTPESETTLQLGAPNGPELGGLFETSANYATVVQGVQSTLSGVQTGVGKLKSWLSKGSIVTVAEAPSALGLLSSFVFEDLPDILGNIAGTVIAADEEMKTRASAAADRAANEHTLNTQGLGDGQRQLESAYEEAKQKHADAARTATEVGVLAADPKADPAVKAAHAAAVEEEKKKAAELAEAQQARDAAIPASQRSALDATHDKVLAAERQKEVAERAAKSPMAVAAQNAANNYKTALAAGKQLYSLIMEVKATIYEAKELTKAVVELASLGASALGVPRVPKVLNVDLPLPLHVIGSESVTHVRSGAYTVVSSDDSVGIHAKKHIVATAEDSVVVVAQKDIELATDSGSLRASSRRVDLHGEKSVVIAAGTPRKVGDASGASVRVLAQSDIKVESVESSFELRAKESVALHAEKKDMRLTSPQIDVEAKEHDVNVSAKEAIHLKSESYAASIDGLNKWAVMGKAGTSDHGVRVDDMDLKVAHPKTVLATSGKGSSVRVDGAVEVATSGACRIKATGTTTVNGSKVMLG
ncbi:MAG: type VI secretion system tip protein VgrG [Myxococcales bacterium]|nr:type VI secretion system tip protein VgrG [Myxococcales bacterium]